MRASCQLLKKVGLTHWKNEWHYHPGFTSKTYEHQECKIELIGCLEMNSFFIFGFWIRIFPILCSQKLWAHTVSALIRRLKYGQSEEDIFDILSDAPISQFSSKYYRPQTDMHNTQYLTGNQREMAFTFFFFNFIFKSQYSGAKFRQKIFIPLFFFSPTSGLVWDTSCSRMDVKPSHSLASLGRSGSLTP